MNHFNNYSATFTLKRKAFINICFITVLLIRFSSVCDAQVKTANEKTITFAALDKFIHKQMDSLKIPGLSVAVINDGKIVYERELGYADLEAQTKVDKNTIFEAASMSKGAFAYFVMKLMQDKKIRLDLDQPVYEYFPYPDIEHDDRYKLITARMLLTHTAGFPNWRKSDTLTLLFTPGTQYSYSGEGYEYMALAVASLTHTDTTTLDALLQKEVVAPLGMAHFGYVRNAWLTNHKAHGYYTNVGGTYPKFKPIPTAFGAAYSLHTNAHEYAKLLIDLMTNKVLKKEYADSLLTPRVRRTEDGKATSKCYGFGFVIDSTKYGPRYQHTGNNGNFTGGFMFFREKKLGFVVFTNGDEGTTLAGKLMELLTNGFE